MRAERESLTADLRTIPNLLSLLRVGLVPCLAAAVCGDRMRWALGLFVAASLTDGLDGLIARRFHQETVVGRYLDTIADKLLTSTAWVLLAMRGLLPAWVAALMIVRDLGIVVVYLVLRWRSGDWFAVRTTRLGKIHTALAMVTLSTTFVVAANLVGGFEVMVEPLSFATVLTALGSGVHYVRRDRAQLIAHGGRSP